MLWADGTSLRRLATCKDGNVHTLIPYNTYSVAVFSDEFFSCLLALCCRGYALMLYSQRFPRATLQPVVCNHCEKRPFLCSVNVAPCAVNPSASCR
jgi:hypothetical protein